MGTLGTISEGHHPGLQAKPRAGALTWDAKASEPGTGHGEGGGWKLGSL